MALGLIGPSVQCYEPMGLTWTEEELLGTEAGGAPRGGESRDRTDVDQ
jgi:hypothetical protein